MAAIQSEATGTGGTGGSLTMDEIKHLTYGTRYACNQACVSSIRKRTMNETGVTCRNCLRIIRKNHLEMNP